MHKIERGGIMSNEQKNAENDLKMEIKEACDFLQEQCRDGVISAAQRDEAIDYIKDLK